MRFLNMRRVAKKSKIAFHFGSFTLYASGFSGNTSGIHPLTSSQLFFTIFLVRICIAICSQLLTVAAGLVSWFVVYNQPGIPLCFPPILLLAQLQNKPYLLSADWRSLERRRISD